MKSTHRKLWRSLQKTSHWYAPSFKNFEKAWLTKMCNYKAHVKKNIWNFPLMPCNNAPMGNSISSFTHPLLHPKSFNFSDVTCDLTPTPPAIPPNPEWTQLYLNLSPADKENRVKQTAFLRCSHFNERVILRCLFAGGGTRVREEVTPKLRGTDLLKGIFKGIFLGGLEGFLFIQAWCM